MTNSPLEPQEPKSCGVLLVCGTPVHSFLLMRHADRWDLPKGHVDPGETEIECALREMQEETGIDPSRIRLDSDFRFEQQYEVLSSRYGAKAPQRYLKTLVIFLAYVDSEYKIAVTEHAGAEWFPWTSPPRAIQLRTIDPLLSHLDRYLQEHGEMPAA